MEKLDEFVPCLCMVCGLETRLLTCPSCNVKTIKKIVFPIVAVITREPEGRDDGRNGR